MARAQEGPIDAWARWVTTQGRWAGPTVPFPEPAVRPVSSDWVLDSEWLPLRLHAPRSVGYARAVEVLAALEHAWLTLIETGWPLPHPDGGRGGSSAFDLYLGEPESSGARAETDVPVAWAPYDAATSWAVLDASVSGEALEACAVSALVQAGMLGQDPAEHAVWREAAGAFAAYLATGQFACADRVSSRQRAAHVAWSDADVGAAAAALFLALVSEREDGGTGEFVRDVWQLARQRSDDGPLLRGSPNVAEALARALANAGESFEEVFVDAAVARYFAGPQARRRLSPRRVLRALPSDAEVPLVREVPLAELSEHVPLYPPLAELGSAYVRIDVAGAPRDSTLPVWLRGDPGARWSMVLVRLDAGGREIGRVVAPHRPVPSSFVPLVLEAGTHAVLAVVTALPKKPDHFTLDPDAERYAKLIVGKPE